MNKNFKKVALFSLIILVSVLFLAGCGGGGGGGTSSTSGSTGTLSVALTDATTDNYQAVYVTIDRIDVHLGSDEEASGAWITVAAPAKTYNLLTLVNGVFAELGQDILTVGNYGQLRLIIGDTADGENNILGNPHPHANYVIDMADDPRSHELKVPSGSQTGIKIIHGFEILPGMQTDLVLDFDASRSVVKAGNSGQYLLKPTIKILEIINSSDIFGTITEANTDPEVPVVGAMVSAQTTESEALAIEDRVTIVAGTVATDAGEYALIVNPGTYNVVVTASGYEAACTPVSIVDTEAGILTDFSLEPLAEPEVVVSGEIIIPPAAQGDDDPYAVISIWQDLTCGELTGTAIVRTEQVAAGGNYSFNLPVGEYTIVVTSAGYDSQSQSLLVSSGGNTPENPLNFEFSEAF